MATLRDVLACFERQSGAVSLAHMARELGLPRESLDEMIRYWVRRGRLREVQSTVCTTCGGATGCPFILKLPRHYELARDSSPAEGAPMGSGGCGCGARYRSEQHHEQQHHHR